MRPCWLSIRAAVSWALLVGICLVGLVKCNGDKQQDHSRSDHLYRRSRSRSGSHYYVTTSVKQKIAASRTVVSLFNSATNSRSGVANDDDNIADELLGESKRRHLQAVMTGKPTKSLKPTARPITGKPTLLKMPTTKRPTTRPITEKPTLTRQINASKKPASARKSPSNATTIAGVRDPQSLLGSYAVWCRTSRPTKRMMMMGWGWGKGSSKSKQGGSSMRGKGMKKKMMMMRLPLCSEAPTVVPMMMMMMVGPGVPTKKPTKMGPGVPTKKPMNMAPSTPSTPTAMMTQTQRPTTMMSQPAQPAAVMMGPTAAPMNSPLKTPTIKPVPAPGSPTIAPVPSVSTPAPSKPPSPPAPGTGVTASPFNLVFDITGGPPSAADFDAAEAIVAQFLENYFNNFFGDLCPMVGFSATKSSTSPNPPVSMGLDVTATFDPNCPVMPTQADVDALLLTALSKPSVDNLIALLGGLPSGNVFSTTTGVSYSVAAKFSAPRLPQPFQASNTTSSSVHSNTQDNTTATQSAIPMPKEPPSVSLSKPTKTISNVPSNNDSITAVEATPTKQTPSAYLVASKPTYEPPSIPIPSSVVPTPRPADVGPKPNQATVLAHPDAVNVTEMAAKVPSDASLP